MTATLLRYTVPSQPSPLATGTDARVDVNVLSTGKVYCDQIALKVPIGAGGHCLFAQKPRVSGNTRKWLGSSAPSARALQAFADVGPDYEVFDFRCAASADFKIDYELVFSLAGGVADAVGSGAILVTEWSGTNADPQTFTAKQASLPLAKQPPAFYLRNFSATRRASSKGGAPTVPVTDVSHVDNATIRFEWESNGTWFELFMKDDPKPCYSNDSPWFELDSSALTRDTTFVLRAAMTGDPGKPGSSVQGFEPLYLYDSITITVSDPVLTPSSMEVDATFSVTGDSVLNDVSATWLEMDRGKVDTTFDVDGTLTAHDVRVPNGALLGATTVRGGLLTASGGLDARTGPVSMLGAGQPIWSGTSIAQTKMKALTDGFVVIQIGYPSASTHSSFAYGHIGMNNAAGQAGVWSVLGGSVGSFGKDWAAVMSNNPNCLCLPIPAGTDWWYSADNVSAQETSSIYIHWFPLGTPSSGAPTVRALTAAEAAVSALPAEPPPPNPADLAARLAARRTAADAFVERLAQAFGSRVDAGVRAELSQLLVRSAGAG